MPSVFRDLSFAPPRIRVECGRAGGEEAFAFSPEEDKLCYLFCPRELAVWGGNVSFYRDGELAPMANAPLDWERFEKGTDVYSFALPSGGETGLYTFLVCVNLPEGPHYITPAGIETYTVASSPAPGHTRQYLIYDRRYPICRWAQGGAIYQIFVDRFFRGDETPLAEGAVRNPDWENGMPQYPAYPGAPLKNNMFFGGNLSGIIEKLPYLADLGINCLYLSPIFKAASNHKYDTGDYMQIDPSFGTEETLKELIDKAGQYGMRIVLDGVFNHTGDDSLYFNRYGRYPGKGAWQSKESPYAGWYTFTSFPDRYDCWWNIPILPKLNLKNPATREYFLGETGVVAHYAALGIGGMRLDVADELDDSFISSVKARLCEATPDAVLFGEVWEDASNKIAYGTRKKYYLGSELDGVMNYPLREGLLAYIKHGRCEPLFYALSTVMRNCPPDVRNTQMNFLGTHDTERALSALGDISYAEKSNDEIARMRMTKAQRHVAISRLMLAFAALATLPGIPCIYYGDEAGMEGYKDPFNRLPYPWKRQETALVDYVRTLLGLRRRHPVFSDGQMKILRLDDMCFAYLRYCPKEKIVTVINRSEHTFCFAADGRCVPLSGGSATAGGILIPPLSACILSADRADTARLYPIH